ncbi:hypothetical protein PBY51_001186 [Eleginops maclovinus]|uniref:Uncharacterized protein n=1 Tax=Eleginops maclovinus TaxID=56733 RepID=A0AAN7XH51_ELEMC|nr:hypothetical protein PBY51_001186 [Eleginops maclovinus]
MKMFCFTAVLWFLLAAAQCSPLGHALQEEPCGAVRKSSLHLNRIARTVSTEARNGSNNIDDFTSALAWIEPKDMCDPQTLKHNPETCLVKLLDVFSSYSSAVQRLSGFESCSKFASKLQPAMHKLHQDMSRCVHARVGRHLQQHLKEERLEVVDPWKQPSLCRFTLDRLFSFSILTARVFAVGDPSQHTAGSYHRCM